MKQSIFTYHKYTEFSLNAIFYLNISWYDYLPFIILTDDPETKVLNLFVAIYLQYFNNILVEMFIFSPSIQKLHIIEVNIVFYYVFICFCFLC